MSSKFVKKFSNTYLWCMIAQKDNIFMTEKILPEWMARQLYPECEIVEDDDRRIIKTLNGDILIRQTSNINSIAHSEEIYE